tara:strand:+ start:211 stop:501 length:291 start_codon:yes stop_codon:yes gene_type:complete
MDDLISVEQEVVVKVKVTLTKDRVTNNPIVLKKINDHIKHELEYMMSNSDILRDIITETLEDHSDMPVLNSGSSGPKMYKAYQNNFHIDVNTEEVA